MSTTGDMPVSDALAHTSASSTEETPILSTSQAGRVDHHIPLRTVTENYSIPFQAHTHAGEDGDRRLRMSFKDIQTYDGSTNIHDWMFRWHHIICRLNSY